MSVEELVKNLKCIGTHDETELWEVIEEAADKLEELAAEAHEWKERVQYLSKCIDEKSAEEDRLKAALAEKNKEIDWQRLCDVINASNRVSARTGKEQVMDASKLREFSLARNAGGSDG